MARPGQGHQAARYLGAAALLGVGVDHIQQYLGASYSVIPTIGTLFALNFVLSALLAIGLLAPIERVFRRRGKLILAVLALSGMGVALGSLIGLLISEHTPLFGFMESGYRQAIVISIVLEVAATLLLGAFLVGHLRSGRHRRPEPDAPRTWLPAARWSGRSEAGRDTGRPHRGPGRGRAERSA
jgi:MFS family permease